MREKLIAGMKKALARAEQYDDRAIANAWVALAKTKPRETVTTAKGLSVEVRRKNERNKVTYKGFVANVHEPVAWMHTMAPTAGRVQVSNANVYEVDGFDYRRQGIATALYDLIEADVLAAGGQGIEPHWGSMNEDAIAFWSNRRPEYAGTLDEMNKIGPPASDLFD